MNTSIPGRKIIPTPEAEKKQLIARMNRAAEQDRIEYAKWWKTLTPQERKEHLDDVSRLCDVEI